MAEPTVPVPVSLPTREQIAEAIWKAGRLGLPEWRQLLESVRHPHYAQADAVLALIQNGADR